MYAPVSNIYSLTMIKRIRFLPKPGRILVQQGQVVSPNEVVAETEFSNKHILLDVAALLHISSEEADSLINCHPGDKVSANQVIAPARGFFSFPVLAPVDGTVLLVGEGQVLLEAGESSYKLMANYPGTVTQLFPDNGVEISAEGSLIQGVWGNGKVYYGNLQSNFVDGNPGNNLNIDRLNTKYRGAIVFANHCSDRKALIKAADLPVRGIILGSISADLLETAQELEFPVIVTEGFGHHILSNLVLELLNRNINRDVVLVGRAYDPYGGTNPEIFIPVESVGKTPPAMEIGILSVGSQVRIILNPALSKIGTVTRMMEEEHRFPSGINLPAAEVKLESGKLEVVPIANLAILN